jgi:tyrosyl-tRNA synthetase
MQLHKKNFEWLRRVDKILPSKEEFLAALSKRKLRFYFGIDPTSPSLHLGHSVGLWFLRDMQKLGHEVIVLLGDFTAQIGDPSGKDATRKALSRNEVRDNMRSYRKQIGKLLDFKSALNPAKIAHNSRWLSCMRLDEFIVSASRHTVQQFLERDMFQQRLRQGKAIALHEFIYPLLQGYDALALRVDCQIGGRDQLFNMLIGRKMAEQIQGRNKFVVTLRLLEDASTGKKMSKTEGTAVTLDAAPSDLFAMVMALPDAMIWTCFELVTDMPLPRISALKKSSRSGRKIREAKALLAERVVSWVHSPLAAKISRTNFDRVFAQGLFPEKIETVAVPKGSAVFLPKFLTEYNLNSSRTEAIRLLEGRGVAIDGKTVTDWKTPFVFVRDAIMRAGKRKFLRIVVR